MSKSWELSEETKKSLERIVGLKHQQMMNMDHDEIEAYIESSTGKKITWPKDGTVDGRPIRTMEDVDKGLDEWVNRIQRKKDSDYER